MRVFGLLVLCATLLAQSTYQPGHFQTANPNYPKPNPFYFEGRVDWDLLKIDQPSNAWEFVQRGIHKQDDLGDIPGAIADYRQAIAMNNLANKTCQLITAAPAGFGQNTNPPPCMFTVRLRLANLLRTSEPDTAIGLLNEVLQIDPLRLGAYALIGEIESARGHYQEAIAAYQAELALSPISSITPDEGNNAHVHWALVEIYRTVENRSGEQAELELYLKATKWHSDTYPWRIQLAQKRLEILKHERSAAHKR